MGIAMASALGTGIAAGIWNWLAGIFVLSTWMGFAGCTSYFVAGCGKTGFIKSVCSNLTGVAWAMFLIVVCSTNNSLIFGSFMTGFITWAMCYQSKIDLLSVVPSTFIGCFSTFAGGGDWKMIIICILLGNVLGVTCDYSGKLLFKIFGKKENPSMGEIKNL